MSLTCADVSLGHGDIGTSGADTRSRELNIDGADDSGNSEQDTEAAIDADTDPGAMRSGGVSVTPGDRGGGDGWVIAAVMADVMSSDLGHQHHREGGFCSHQEAAPGVTSNIPVYNPSLNDVAAVWEPGLNGICRD